MMAAAMRRISTLVREDPTRAKSYIFWATEEARKLVVAVLKEEPAEKFGLRHPALFKNIMDRFPDMKLPDHLIPPAANAAATVSMFTINNGVPPHPVHPIRSSRYLKIVLAEMESKGQVDQIRIVRGRTYDENGIRMDAIHCKLRKTVETMATDVVDKEEWRWRLVPGADLTPFSEPNPGEMFDVRENAAREKHKKHFKPPPREVTYTRLGTRLAPHKVPRPPREFTTDEPPHARIARTGGLSSPVLRTLSQFDEERFRSTNQRSAAGQRRHYSSSREIWPNSRTETFQSERYPYRRSESRRRPAPVNTEPSFPSKPSLKSSATRSTSNPTIQDELVFFHEVPIKDASEESSPPKKYVKPTLTAVLKNREKWEPIGFSRAKREGLVDQLMEETREVRRQRAHENVRTVPRVPAAKHKSPWDELHLFRRTERDRDAPHQTLTGSQLPQTTTVDKYAKAMDYARSTAPRPAAGKTYDDAAKLTLWQQALQEMEANLIEREQKLQLREQDASLKDRKDENVQDGPVTMENTTERISERPATPRTDSSNVQPTKESTFQEVSPQELNEWNEKMRLQEELETLRRERIKRQAVQEKAPEETRRRAMEQIQQEKARATLEMKRRALVPPGSSSFISTLGSRLTKIDTPVPGRPQYPFRPQTFGDTERAVLKP